MPTKTIIIQESTAQSILSDFFTFGSLLLCIWASWKIDSAFWQFILGTMWIAWLIAKVARSDEKNYRKFCSFEEAHEWLEAQIGKKP